MGRPTPLYRAQRLGEAAGGVDVYLKREDLNHTGAHKINNTLGQVLLARRMGKRRIIAETGAGQHGVATATVCALFGLDCVVYMGEEDVRRQALNVYRMRLLGAEVRPVASGTRTLKDATNEAIRDWVTNVQDTHYIIGSVVGPDPYPRMVRDFQSVIGREARRADAGASPGGCPRRWSPAWAAARTRWGSSTPSWATRRWSWWGWRRRGRGWRPAATRPRSRRAGRACCTASLSYLLQDEHGQVSPAHCVSAGLDYPGVGPEHAALKDTRPGASTPASPTRRRWTAFERLARLEGIIPALESAHAIAYLLREGERWRGRGPVVICLSGRGDKDVAQVAELTGGA